VMPMQYSLNEVQTMSLKATRGAGLPWGVATDAGLAARWLEARELPGVAALSQSLQSLDGQDIGGFQPHTSGPRWRSGSGRLLGLLAGIALSDRCEAADITLENVIAPVLLLPFIAGIAATCRLNFSIGAEAGTPVSLFVTADRVSVESSALAELTLADTVSLATTNVEPAGMSRAPINGGATIDDGAWRVLEAFAQRIYVPESDESRARGAGSGENDAD